MPLHVSNFTKSRREVLTWFPLLLGTYASRSAIFPSTHLRHGAKGELLFADLVGAGEQLRRNFKPERFSSHPKLFDQIVSTSK